MFVTDQLMGSTWGEQNLPFLHKWYTLNYTYRGLWGTMIVTAVLFTISSWAHLTASAADAPWTAFAYISTMMNLLIASAAARPAGPA